MTPSRSFFMCCHPSLPPAGAVALTLRAVGGLTTKEIATAFLVPEATMAQRISRAKRSVAESGEPFSPPGPDSWSARLGLVLRVVYLIFNEGYASSGGPDLGRNDLATEALRLGRLLRDLLPDEAEVSALLALMLLHEARRPARTGPDGALVPLEAAGPFALGSRPRRRGHRTRRDGPRPGRDGRVRRAGRGGGAA